MIDVTTTMRMQAVQFPTTGAEQIDIVDELRGVGVVARLLDVEHDPEAKAWKSLAFGGHDRWARWAKPGEWIVVLEDAVTAPHIIILTDVEYQATFSPKPHRHTLVSSIVDELVESATASDADTSWASDLEPTALERIGDLLYIGGRYSIDMRQLVEDTLRAAARA